MFKVHDMHNYISLLMYHYIYIGTIKIDCGEPSVRSRQRAFAPKPSSHLRKTTFEATESIQFSYHREKYAGLLITDFGLGAEKINLPSSSFHASSRGFAYGAQPLKGMAEFEVKLTSDVKFCGTISLGLKRCKKGTPLVSKPRLSIVPVDSCMWTGTRLHNGLVTPAKKSDYDLVNLNDLCIGDHLGIRVSRSGVLEFFVNGESQGIAARNMYNDNSDVSAVVEHRGNSVSTTITKAGEVANGRSD